MAFRFTYKLSIPEPMMGPLDSKLSEYPGCARYREKYLFVLHLVARQLRRVYRDRRMVGSDVAVSTWHCNLQSVFLHAAIGNDYTTVVGDLIRWGFIGRSQSYLVGSGVTKGKSKAFWFQFPYSGYWMKYCCSREQRRSDFTGEVHRVGRVKTVHVKSRAFLKRLEQCAEDAKMRQMGDARIRNCHESLKHFSIDRKQAERVLDGMVSGGAIADAKRRSELGKVDRFNGVADSRTALFVKKDRFGRIHTNITQMKKEVRSSCLYCDGRPTGAVDIKSSQGAFLGAIFRSLLDTGGFLSLESSPTMNELRRRVSIRDRARYEAECARYDALLNNGALYEFFADELSLDFDLDREVGRDEAKHSFFLMVFGPVMYDGPENEMRAAVRRVWCEHFPALLLALEQMKSGNYAALAREMQRAESRFVFGQVIPRVESELHCHYCTVHDEIYVETGFVSRLKHIMDEELRRVNVPTMTSEEFGMTWPDADTDRFERDVANEMLGIGVSESAARIA